eukprot:c5511_g1_i3.p3 GENE.c5511_g1_i3~~c5511_g1_i3.p3  ORF type:complete len:107 (+),score=23.32 c5511_g1_i3:627-947(+)
MDWSKVEVEVEILPLVVASVEASDFGVPDTEGGPEWCRARYRRLVEWASEVDLSGGGKLKGLKPDESVLEPGLLDLFEVSRDLSLRAFSWSDPCFMFGSMEVVFVD